MGVTSIADAREIERKIEFKRKCEELRESIKSEIRSRERNADKELEAVNAVYIEKMNELLGIDITDDDVYEYVCWFFNYGDLRTEEEVAERDKAIKDTEYVQSGMYERDCKANKTAWGVGGFLAGSIITFAAVEDFHNPAIFLVIGWMVCGFVGMLFALIGMAIASSMNIENAKSHNVPKNHPRYRHDRRELGLCGISGVIAAGTIARKAHKTAKDIGNVDSWKEMN